MSLTQKASMISVVLATYNEEKNIERCLNSVVELADEIIVVDGSSTDGTRSLAKKLGAKVIKTTNKPNFHINKQLAIDEASGNLILQLDADEEVDSDLAVFIKQLNEELSSASKKNRNSMPAAWWIARKNLFLGRFLTKGGQYPDPVIRLFQAGRAHLPQKDVHEQMTVDGAVGTAEGHLVHYANPTFGDYLRKFNTYTTFKAQQLSDQGVKPSLQAGVQFLIWKPVATWISLFFRHKGFLDGVPGFVFAAFSGLHHAVAYLKLWEIHVQA